MKRDMSESSPAVGPARFDNFRLGTLYDEDHAEDGTAKDRANPDAPTLVSGPPTSPPPPVAEDWANLDSVTLEWNRPDSNATTYFFAKTAFDAAHNRENAIINGTFEYPIQGEWVQSTDCTSGSCGYREESSSSNDLPGTYWHGELASNATTIHEVLGQDLPSLDGTGIYVKAEFDYYCSSTSDKPWEFKLYNPGNGQAADLHSATLQIADGSSLDVNVSGRVLINCTVGQKGRMVAFYGAFSGSENHRMKLGASQNLSAGQSIYVDNLSIVPAARTDVLAPITEYHFEFDNAADTTTRLASGTVLADTQAVVSHSETVPSNSVDGSGDPLGLYAHVFAKDMAGNWSAPMHYGPLWIDNEPPEEFTITCTNHVHEVWDADVTTRCSWEPVGGPSPGDVSVLHRRIRLHLGRHRRHRWRWATL